MSRYQTGKIYKIVSQNTDKIYIGSTIQNLEDRLKQHYLAVKTHENGNARKSTSYKVLDSSSSIILIENFSCNSKLELESRERYWIEQNLDFCVNEKVPTRTKKENPNYREKLEQSYQRKKEKRDKILPVERAYRESHPDKVKQWKKNYSEKHKEEIKEQQRKYREKNKEKIKEYLREYHEKRKALKEML
jgi:hypothetical protein